MSRSTFSALRLSLFTCFKSTASPPGQRSSCRRLCSPLFLGAVQQISAPINGTASAARAYARMSVECEIRFVRKHQERHSHIANLGVFEFDFALRALENPLRHRNRFRAGKARQSSFHLAAKRAKNLYRFAHFSRSHRYRAFPRRFSRLVTRREKLNVRILALR
jgi:hypothetical protein